MRIPTLLRTELIVLGFVPYPNLRCCRACGGAVRIIACIEDPLVIEKILTYLDKKDASSEASRLPPCRAPPLAGLLD